MVGGGTSRYGSFIGPSNSDGEWLQGYSCMFTFLVKRLFQAVIVMFVISLVAFSIQDNLGDPLREMVGHLVVDARPDKLGPALA